MSTNAAGLYALCSILPALSTVVVALRFYVRRQKKQNYGADDWTSLAGLIGLWGIAGVVIHATIKGLFGGDSMLDPETGAMIRSWREGPNVKFSWIVPIITVVSLAPIKLSVIFLYRRVFHISSFFSYYSIWLCVLLVAWAVSFTFASTFQCGTHPAAYWTSVATIQQFCGDFGGLNVAMCFTDLILDVLVLLAPVVMIWKMRFDVWRKFQIVGVFALGFLSTAAAATRVYIMWVDAYSTTPGHNNLIRENTKIVMWCLIEVSSALIACCLPVLRPLIANTWFSRFLNKVGEKVTSDSSKGSSAREMEEGMAFRSIGGTEFRVTSPVSSRSQKDSKLSTNVDTNEIDPTKEIINESTKELGLETRTTGKDVEDE